MRYAALIVSALILSACDSGGDEPARITGTYSGTAQVSLAGESTEIPVSHVFVIREDVDGFVDGELTLRIDGGEAFEYEVSGTHTGGTFDLDIEGSSSGLDYRGSSNADATTLTGVMDWPAGTLNDYTLVASVSGSAASPAPSSAAAQAETAEAFSGALRQIEGR